MYDIVMVPSGSVDAALAVWAIRRKQPSVKVFVVMPQDQIKRSSVRGKNVLVLGLPERQLERVAEYAGRVTAIGYPDQYANIWFVSRPSLCYAVWDTEKESPPPLFRAVHHLKTGGVDPYLDEYLNSRKLSEAEVENMLELDIDVMRLRGCSIAKFREATISKLIQTCRRPLRINGRRFNSVMAPPEWAMAAAHELATENNPGISYYDTPTLRVFHVVVRDDQNDAMEIAAPFGAIGSKKTAIFSVGRGHILAKQ